MPKRNFSVVFVDGQVEVIFYTPIAKTRFEKKVKENNEKALEIVKKLGCSPDCMFLDFAYPNAIIGYAINQEEKVIVYDSTLMTKHLQVEFDFTVEESIDCLMYQIIRSKEMKEKQPIVIFK